MKSETSIDELLANTGRQNAFETRPGRQHVEQPSGTLRQWKHHVGRLPAWPIANTWTGVHHGMFQDLHHLLRIFRILHEDVAGDVLALLMELIFTPAILHVIGQTVPKRAQRFLVPFDDGRSHEAGLDDTDA